MALAGGRAGGRVIPPWLLVAAEPWWMRMPTRRAPRHPSLPGSWRQGRLNRHPSLADGHLKEKTKTKNKKTERTPHTNVVCAMDKQLVVVLFCPHS